MKTTMMVIMLLIDGLGKKSLGSTRGRIGKREEEGIWSLGLAGGFPGFGDMRVNGWCALV